MTTPAQVQREREKARVARIAAIADRCDGDRWEIDTDGKQAHIIATRSTGDKAVLCTIYEDALPDEIELISGALADAVLFLELRRRAIIALKNGARCKAKPALSYAFARGRFRRQCGHSLRGAAVSPLP